MVTKNEGATSGSVLYLIRRPKIPPGIKLINVYVNADFSKMLSLGAVLNYPDSIRHAKT
jgi:hypothetical protein